jgi:hypothetical protein
MNSLFRQRELLSIGADKSCPSRELGLVDLGKFCNAKNLTCNDMNETHSTLLNKENHLVKWGSNVTSWLLRFCSGVAEDYYVLLGHDTALVDNQALFQASMMSSSSRTH